MPVPVALFLYATGNILVLSFVPAALFTGDRLGSGAVAYRRVAAPWLLALGRSPAVRAAGGGLGVAGLVAAAVTGSTWAWLWAVLLPACGLAGGVWTWLNPWAALHGLLPHTRPRLALPERLGGWPAVAVLFVLAWGPPLPWWAFAAYTAATLLGMTLFGRDEWLGRCEGVSVLLGLAGRFGPVEAERDEQGRLTGVWLRPWGVGLLRPERPGWDRIALVVLLLGALAVQGLMGTAPWRAFAGALAPLGLLLVTAAFLLGFSASARLMLAIASARESDLTAVTAFALTLVPIALLYAVALSAGTLLTQVTGPLPRWATPRPDAVWYLQVTLVVLGHADAVYLAHLRAGERFRSSRRALLGQYPMVVLLVSYTMTSMWILAQPLV